MFSQFFINILIMIFIGFAIAVLAIALLAFGFFDKIIEKHNESKIHKENDNQKYSNNSFEQIKEKNINDLNYERPFSDVSKEKFNIEELTSLMVDNPNNVYDRLVMVIKYLYSNSMVEEQETDESDLLNRVDKYIKSKIGNLEALKDFIIIHSAAKHQEVFTLNQKSQNVYLIHKDIKDHMESVIEKAGGPFGGQDFFDHIKDTYQEDNETFDIQKMFKDNLIIELEGQTNNNVFYPDIIFTKDDFFNYEKLEKENTKWEPNYNEDIKNLKELSGWDKTNLKNKYKKLNLKNIEDYEVLIIDGEYLGDAYIVVPLQEEFSREDFKTSFKLMTAEHPSYKMPAVVGAKYKGNYYERMNEWMWFMYDKYVERSDVYITTINSFLSEPLGYEYKDFERYFKNLRELN